MQTNLGLQFDLCNPLQSLTQNAGFEFQLTLVGNVLVMASAALPEVWAASFDAIGRCLDQLHYRATRESRLLLPDLDVYSFSGQYKRNKHRHAAPVRANWRACQPVTAVDQLFDGKKHGVLRVSIQQAVAKVGARNLPLMPQRVCHPERSEGSAFCGELQIPRFARDDN